MSAIYPSVYHTHVKGFGSPNGRYTFSQPLCFSGNKKQAIRLNYASITNTICNIYKTTSFNNGLLRVSNDNGVTWTNIQLNNGIYNASDINLAIQDIISSWYAKTSAPAFKLMQNDVVQKVYCIIDSTKLSNINQFCIDFGVSEIKTLLGCTTTSLFNKDGTFEFDDYPLIEWTGARINVKLTGIGFPLSYLNGVQNEQICSIPKNSTSQELVSPGTDGISYPMIYGKLPERFYGFDVEFVGSTGKPIYLLEGEAFVSIEFIDF